MRFARTKVLPLLALCGAALPTEAAINGYYDAVYIQMTDTAYGWICESTDPTTAPPGDLVVYKDGPAGGGGSLYMAQSVSSAWGSYRPDVPAAGFCGSNQYTGWSLFGWFDGTSYVYYREPGGTLHLLGGSPKTCSGYGWCY